MNTGIYAIENTVNGKTYVGSAVNLKVREQRHLRDLRCGEHHSRKLQNSYNKHGEGVFVFKPLLVCREEDLLFYEQLAIDKYDTVKTGYNIAPTAGSAPGIKRSDETRIKMSASIKARYADLEFSARNNAARKAYYADSEVKAKTSAALKARYTDPEYRVKHSTATRAGLADPEAVAKMSAKTKARWADPEYRARMSARARAQWGNPEMRAKMQSHRGAVQ